MISARILRRRIKSVQSIAKICRAMEMIATVKLKRTQNQALAGRPYTEAITQVIGDLAARTQMDLSTPPLLQKREVGKITLVHIASDRGLCGGLNANLNRRVAKFILEHKDRPVSVITVGRRGRAFARYTKLNIRAEFHGISDAPTLRDTLPISRLIIDEYSHNETDQVFLAYPTFVSIMNQKPTLDPILPIEPAKTTSLATEYIYEPNAKTVLDELLPRFIEMRVYHAILELIASEQASRMVAMRNASDNARSVIEGLTLTLNKVRQETITKEICDISGGAEAFNK